MRSLVLAVLVLIAASSTPLAAQDALSTVHVGYWKCDWDALDELQEKATSVWIPAAQQVQDGGKWGYSQYLFHDWGDEWNLIFYTRAADVPTFLAGFNEWISLLNEREPDGFEWFTERCHEHKDNFYRSVAQTTIPTP